MQIAKQMQREAKRRLFFESPAKAFLGDDLPWNWSIWKERFSDFTPILDFIHALSYGFIAAKTIFPESPANILESVSGMDACLLAG